MLLGGMGTIPEYTANFWYNKKMEEHFEKIKNIKNKQINGFKDFLRNQGVLPLAVGFILGGAVSKLVTSLVSDIIYPILSGLLGGVEGLEEKYFMIGNASIKYGIFINTLIDFIVVAFVVYIGIKILGIDEDRLKKK